MKKIIPILILLFNVPLFSQNGPTSPLSVRSNGVGNASVAFNDINSLFNNQAGLANLEKMGFLFSGEETFRNPNSDNLGAGFAAPTSLGAFGVNWHYSANDRLSQIKIGLAYARKLSEKISVGVQFDRLSTQLLMEEKRHLFTFEIGLQAALTKKLLVGIHLYNPMKLEIIKNEFSPTIWPIELFWYCSECGSWD